jgi:hypothetical protein
VIHTNDELYGNGSSDPTAKNSTGFVEPSTVTRVVLPSVTGWNIKSSTLTGHVVLNSDTLNIGSGFNLSVIDPQSVVSRKDKYPQYLTCDYPVIGGINNVLPDSLQHNVNIVAVEPLKITSLGDGKFHLTLEDVVIQNPQTGQKALCKKYNIPPDNQTNAPTGTLAETSPEYPTWPQFNQS